jgi:hypothetical protein
MSAKSSAGSSRGPSYARMGDEKSTRRRNKKTSNLIYLNVISLLASTEKKPTIKDLRGHPGPFQMLKM